MGAGKYYTIRNGISYDPGSSARILAFIGLAVSALVGTVLIVGGVLLARRGDNTHVNTTSLVRSLAGLALNLLVTICTESIGFVHSTTLKWSLQDQGNLDFNANVRVFRFARGFFSPNGPIANILMGILLIISYASSSIALLGNLNQGALLSPAVETTRVSSFGLIVLGSVLVAQFLLAALGALTTHVPTWSTSPLDVAAAAQSEAIGAVQHQHGRCMRSVGDDSLDGPTQPRLSQPSAWRCIPHVRHIVYLTWALVPLGLLWGGISLGVYIHQRSASGSDRSINWSLVPSSSPTHTSPFLTLNLGWTPAAEAPLLGLVWALFLISLSQGLLTLGLHAAELVINLYLDECLWKLSTTTSGTSSDVGSGGRNPLKSVLGSWPSLGLLIFKPLIHWLFGLGLTISTTIGLQIHPVQILYTTASIVVFAGFTTLVATRGWSGKRGGMQPVAYGHIQTLVNLIDEWNAGTMWWGHKWEGEGGVCHAGTSGEILPGVRVGAWYAGKEKGKKGDLMVRKRSHQ
ncbi:hypothetical protein BOTBODRAFT_38965 [Botryobasidium botryosum FD-172 SS1]|uniref:Uncharacterized protein n=1 Tax=Botryobasidium botryosum (strain FD-172 SS1) TaxID=930990 RepID=A0A067LY27_BOTB1|nr:hypothetical protein BOTBODRAFT_38965 [Botryobasidium botryosum FD-172 SS1]